jgi:hypothetical protein
MDVVEAQRLREDQVEFTADVLRLAGSGRPAGAARLVTAGLMLDGRRKSIQPTPVRSMSSGTVSLLSHAWRAPSTALRIHDRR